MSTQCEGSMMPWDGGALPAGVSVGENTCIIGKAAFRRFRGQPPNALVIGDHATMDGVQFSVGSAGRINIGNFCCFTSAVLMCELSISIGSYVLIMDNFRAPEDVPSRRRMLEAFAAGRDRRPPAPVKPRPVVIGNNVWIGFDCCILPGVRIGEGSIIGARSVVDGDIPPYCIASGNPARIIRFPREKEDSLGRRIQT